jgi:cytochrome c
LAAKIKAGGTGVWGEDVMPPQANVSDADAKLIAQLVLSLK